MFWQTNLRTVAWTIEPDAWWELSLWEELFRSHKNLRGVAASFWCLWCCYDSLYELEKNTLALMLRQKKFKKKNQTNKQTKNTFPMFQWVQCPVSTLSRSSNLWEKIWKNKNGFNVCFQNKANVPITIINCGVCLKPCQTEDIWGHFEGIDWHLGKWSNS